MKHPHVEASDYAIAAAGVNIWTKFLPNGEQDSEGGIVFKTTSQEQTCPATSSTQNKWKQPWFVVSTARKSGNRASMLASRSHRARRTETERAIWRGKSSGVIMVTKPELWKSEIGALWIADYQTSDHQLEWYNFFIEKSCRCWYFYGWWYGLWTFAWKYHDRS